jgi:TATA-box binding protein (TBP) (component of TFIID and TFIIIB)
MNQLDDEWLKFINGETPSEEATCEDAGIPSEPPEFNDLYISTKTKLLYLDQKDIDVARLFWNIPVVEYWKPLEGVIKKQMKVAAATKAECEANQERLRQTYYYTEHIIKQIDNPIAKTIKFKDERKVTIGISTKNVMNYRGKEKGGAMFNCIALTFRFRNNLNSFHEIHVKIFNTGKLEIPGVLNSDLFDSVKGFILSTLRPYFETPIAFKDIPSENVLINSNFECNYNINRDMLHTILRSEKYRIDTTFDSCSYPGVKCKFYFCNKNGFDMEKQRGVILPEDSNMTVEELIVSKKYTKVSFMIFRTGGCLIVGNCSEEVLRFVYEFVKTILKDEFANIYMRGPDKVVEDKEAKQRKRKITVSSSYFSDIKRITPSAPFG